MTTPSNTQKLTYILRHFEKSLEMAGKATKEYKLIPELQRSDWEADPVYAGRIRGGSVRIQGIDVHDLYCKDASFIAAARTDCPMVMEMVVEQIDYMIEMSGADGSGWVLYRLGNKLISRFESTHGQITIEQVEEL